MPPTRRSRASGGGPAAKGSQKTLSFSNSAKVTKPASTAVSTKDKINSSLTPAAAKAKVEDVDVDVGHVTSEAAIAQQAKQEIEKVERSEEEVRARRITDAQVRKYWRAREAERKAPRGEFMPGSSEIESFSGGCAMDIADGGLQFTKKI